MWCGFHCQWWLEASRCAAREGTSTPKGLAMGASGGPSYRRAVEHLDSAESWWFGPIEQQRDCAYSDSIGALASARRNWRHTRDHRLFHPPVSIVVARCLHSDQGVECRWGTQVTRDGLPPDSAAQPEPLKRRAPWHASSRHPGSRER